MSYPSDQDPISQPTYEIIELLFFGYRDFIRGPDCILDRYGFGRAHHRVLHFVNRHPGLKVTELLDILKITKQSLGRVLRDVVDQGFVESRLGTMDRRQRLLYVTDKGSKLAMELAQLQARQIESALAAMPAGSQEQIKTFLLGMVANDDREAVRQRMSRVAQLEPAEV
ncbi:MarR family winged helix-turn-helix transcriptional regulator [Agaricicola taiwanensis]|uniref:MarR family winged helix-turn-helix transcriptional regulator n=1 Tax=Agaricicola taiwanensis TaxID=591372 RepID=UPI001E3E0981|nr:MarR family transcriptional regulator [Agaricicola taiwanensis]